MRSILLGIILLHLLGCANSSGSVGIRDFIVVPELDNPGFSSRMWYPTNDGVEQRFGVSRIRPGYLAVDNAPVALTEQAPLVILIHGSGGSADSMAWLATALARRGTLVIAADHPHSSGGDPERAAMLEVWNQPEDVRLLLDQLLASQWRTYIDSNRIVTIGFSLGGATALSLAGARLQFERFPSFCSNHNDGACRAFQQHFTELDNDFYMRANADFMESRIRATVAIAPGFSESLTAESLQTLNTPLLLIAGANDQQLPPTTHIHPILPLLPVNSRYLEITEAQHFSFLPVCGDEAMEVLAETNEEFVCLEPGNKSREQIHLQVLSAIEDFFNAQGVFAKSAQP